MCEHGQCSGDTPRLDFTVYVQAWLLCVFGVMRALRRELWDRRSEPVSSAVMSHSRVSFARHVSVLPMWVEPWV